MPSEPDEDNVTAERDVAVTAVVDVTTVPLMPVTVVVFPVRTIPVVELSEIFPAESKVAVTPVSSVMSLIAATKFANLVLTAISVTFELAVAEVATTVPAVLVLPVDQPVLKVPE